MNRKGWRNDFRTNGGASLDEIAQELQCSKQNVERIQREALNKLRFNLWKQGLTLADLLPEQRETWYDRLEMEG